MVMDRKGLLAIYVDRTTLQWIVRDAEGNFWTVAAVDDAWNKRQPFELTEHSELEPIPGHYKYLLRLP